MGIWAYYAGNDIAGTLSTSNYNWMKREREHIRLKINELLFNSPKKFINENYKKDKISNLVKLVYFDSARSDIFPFNNENYKKDKISNLVKYDEPNNGGLLYTPMREFKLNNEDLLLASGISMEQLPRYIYRLTGHSEEFKDRLNKKKKRKWYRYFLSKPTGKRGLLVAQYKEGDVLSEIYRYNEHIDQKDRSIDWGREEDTKVFFQYVIYGINIEKNKSILVSKEIYTPSTKLGINKFEENLIEKIQENWKKVRKEVKDKVRKHIDDKVN